MNTLKNMTVVATGKLRQVAYDLLNEETNLLSWQESGRVPQAELENRLAQADALYSIGNIKIDSELLDKAPKLKVIAQASVGYDNIDVEACNARGIAVGNTPGVLVDAVADLAYGLIIDSARSIARGWQHVESGKWGERKGLGFGTDLAGKTLGIVGVGDIGSAVIPRASASKMKIVYHNRSRRSDEGILGIEYVSFEELLKRSDFILVTVNLNSATENMFSAAEFEKMKPTARFINVSRGKVVDTMALCDALKNKQIAYAALDVVEPEPIAQGHPLLELPNITITPHIATSTVETRDAMAQLAAKNILAGLAGEQLPAEVKIKK